MNEDAGLMSNGPYSTMPIVWAWEYGSRANKTEMKERWWPLVKGEADFFACFLQLDPADGYLHDLHDCTNESPGLCPSKDTVLTLSMMRRSFDVVSDMAAFLGEPVDPRWAAVLAKVAPNPLGAWTRPLSGDLSRRCLPAEKCPGFACWIGQGTSTWPARLRGCMPAGAATLAATLAATAPGSTRRTGRAR